MNEQEAMETLERLFSDSTNEDYSFTECFAEALTIAIQALEEVQRYRAIGTPEELQDMKSRYRRNLYLVITLVILFLYSIANAKTQSKSVTI